VIGALLIILCVVYCCCVGMAGMGSKKKTSTAASTHTAAPKRFEDETSHQDPSHPGDVELSAVQHTHDEEGERHTEELS